MRAGSKRWRAAATALSGRLRKLPAGRSLRLLADRKRTNLPESLTSFVGRERELAEIKQRLPATRLLTLTGIGGIGKTRLAQQAAAEMLDAYRDGVWFVDLAPLGDPALVPSALAQVLQVKEAPGSRCLRCCAITCARGRPCSFSTTASMCWTAARG